MLLILKQHLLPLFCFTIKQACLIVIKRKAFSNHTLFYTFAALFLHFFVYLSKGIHLSLMGRNSAMIFPPSSSFTRPVTFLFLPMGSGLFSSFEYPLVSNPFSLYLVNKAASIHIAQFNFAAILRSHVLVMKLMH